MSIKVTIIIKCLILSNLEMSNVTLGLMVFSFLGDVVSVEELLGLLKDVAHSVIEGASSFLEKLGHG